MGRFLHHIQPFLSPDLTLLENVSETPAVLQRVPDLQKLALKITDSPVDLIIW